jgi:thymidylate synthase
MPESYLPGKTFDDVLRAVLEEIMVHGVRTTPTKGAAADLTGVLIEISDPRARISRTETRGQPFSCLGELCWYLAKTNDARFIAYYIPQYRTYADGSIIFGGYGPRLFEWKDQDQVAKVTELLRHNADTRKAVIQLFDAADTVREHRDVPCTCTLQFVIRRGALHMITYMRSNDAFLGLPHDVFSFTMLQEIIARTLAVELGTYKHAIGSLHLYDKNRDAAQRFLDEGWQSTKTPMPPMPVGDPWPAIDSLRKAEAAIRTEGVAAIAELERLDPYWADLIRLLQVFRCWKDKNVEKMRALRDTMSSNIYRPFIDKKLSALT